MRQEGRSGGDGPAFGRVARRLLAIALLCLSSSTHFGGVAAAYEPRTLRVPRDYPSIQSAVNDAVAGDLILISPGVYEETISVTTKGLTIQGVDRFRTVLDGGGRLGNGIAVQSGDGIEIRNLTVRDYFSNGIIITDTTGYLMERIDAIKNRIYGLYAFRSYDGAIKDSFAWGSGDAGVYIGECLDCKGLVEDVHAEWNLIGYSGTNATGVTIRNSRFVNNAVGVMPNTLPLEGLAPNRGTLIVDNVISDNNNSAIAPASIWETIGVPTGTGVWLYGVLENVVRRNDIDDNDRYGVLISHGPDPNGTPMGNVVSDNRIRGDQGFALAWDGLGLDNCFSENAFATETAPPAMETLYPCEGRPVVGVPYGPVIADVAVAAATDASVRGSDEAPEPKRPRCQRGARACRG